MTRLDVHITAKADSTEILGYHISFQFVFTSMGGLRAIAPNCRMEDDPEFLVNGRWMRLSTMPRDLLEQRYLEALADSRRLYQPHRHVEGDGLACLLSDG